MQEKLLILRLCEIVIDKADITYFCFSFWVVSQNEQDVFSFQKILQIGILEQLLHKHPIRTGRGVKDNVLISGQVGQCGSGV